MLPQSGLSVLLDLFHVQKLQTLSPRMLQSRPGLITIELRG